MSELAANGTRGPADRPAWAAKAERGTHAALGFMIRSLRAVGRRRMRWILHPIAAYFTITDRRARRASQAYLARVAAFPAGREALGSKRGWLATYHHLYEFSMSIFDRTCVFAGIDSEFVFEHEGAAHFDDLPDAEGERANALGKSGAIILGAHLGTFEMMRSQSLDAAVPVTVVVYGANSETIQAFFRSLDTDFDVNMIHVVPGSSSAALQIRAAVERGDWVAILADRAGLDGGGSHATSLLGSQVRLPLGPFQIATMIGCPILLATASRVGDARYRVESELLYAGAQVPRRERGKVVAELVERYAEYLERTCLRIPYQWFNFYEYWDEDAEANR